MHLKKTKLCQSTRSQKKWNADSEDYSYKKNNRTHQRTFGGGSSVKASVAPKYGNGESEHSQLIRRGAMKLCGMLFREQETFKNQLFKKC